MDSLRQGVAHPCDRAEGVGARSQVGDGTQIFERVALLGNGVRVGFDDPTGDMDAIGVNFPALAATLGSDDNAADLDGASGGEGGDLVVVGEALVCHHLDRVETRAVVYVDE